SAISMGRVVQILWPISLWASSTVMLSSLPICRKAFGVNTCSPAGIALFDMKRFACGIANAMTRPPATKAEALRKVRLDTFLMASIRALLKLACWQHCEWLHGYEGRCRSDRCCRSWQHRYRHPKEICSYSGVRLRP